MSPPEPYVPVRRRRTWLWVLGGILGAFLLLCVVVLVLGSTVFRDEIDAMATQISIDATRQAGGAPLDGQISAPPSPATIATPSP